MKEIGTLKTRMEGREKADGNREGTSDFLDIRGKGDRSFRAWEGGVS